MSQSSQCRAEEEEDRERAARSQISRPAGYSSMGSCCAKQTVENDTLELIKNPSNKNVHVTIPGLVVHAVLSNELDYDHTIALKIALGEVSDEQLVAEIANRKLDVSNRGTLQVDETLHERAMKKKLADADEGDLFAEVNRRRIDICDKINDALIYESYEMIETLGQGASGKVMLCKHKMTGSKYACKIIKRNSDINDAQSMSTEMEILKRIRHENVVALFELFESPKCLWLILELIDGGDLRKFIGKARPNYSEENAATHTKQILEGVHYLHSMGVIHRDLKLENILLKKNGKDFQVKIADFGLSALVRIGEQGYDTTRSSKRKDYDALHEPWGTVEYEAPELLDGAYGPQADVWAVGCIVFEMLSGTKAFAPRSGEKSLGKLFNRIRRGEVDMRSPAWRSVTSLAKDLVTGLLRVDPKKRLSASEALRHKWIATVAKNAPSEESQHLVDGPP